ncbi:MAG TPA: M20/M25/M40 family metallo-hydrolase [Longimicrobium sp.]
MTRSRPIAPLALALLAAAPAAAQTGEPPRTHAPRPTTAAITPADLMTRLYVLADDSMRGREAGKRGNAMGTDYVAAEFRRLGLEPAGENGTFFQAVPLVVNALEPGAALTVDGAPLRPGEDFFPVPRYGTIFPFGPAFAAQGADVVYGGRIGAEMIDPGRAAGKVVVFAPPPGQDGRANYRFWAGNPGLERYAGAALVAVASLDVSPPSLLEFFGEERMEMDRGEGAGAGAAGVLVSAAAAERMLGVRLANARVGAAGKKVGGGFRFAARPTEAPARNVVAVLRGRDPAARGEYVVVSAHNDHDGVLPEAFDHDSVRAYNRVMRPRGANDDPGEPSNGQWARITAIRDSLRRAHGGVRMDSVMNGADDDGSGTVTLLEIAEELASRGERPRRSILFVSHTAEEKGLYGSEWFTDHPTVPRESIVAALNMDMVGRGRAEDVPGGGPWYLQMIGSRRLSTELGELIDALNAGRPNPMRVDYSFDAPGHPLNRYCRSDHFMYARYGIPITYFSLGYHVDYHQVSDEPQYIDYDHMARVASFVHDVAVAVAERERRLVVDKPKPDPKAPCRQ